MTTPEKPSLADSFRMLADLIDEHPEIAEWFRFPSFGQHLTAKKAGALDRFAELFGASIEHDQRPNPANGTFYSDIETRVGVLPVRLQCDTGDYETATGKTVERNAESKEDAS